MKNLNVKITICALSLITASALPSCIVTSPTETAKGVDFSKYQTFARASSDSTKSFDRANHDIADNNIKNSIGRELEKKGWMEGSNHPDVIPDYTVAAQKPIEHETKGVYSPPSTQYIYGRHGL